MPDPFLATPIFFDLQLLQFLIVTGVRNRVANRAFRVGPGLNFEKLSGFNRAGRWNKIEIFREWL